MNNQYVYVSEGTLLATTGVSESVFDSAVGGTTGASITIAGMLFAEESNGIYLEGDGSGIGNNFVTILESGSVTAWNVGIALIGSNNVINNYGTVNGFIGVGVNGSDSQILNHGSISGETYGIALDTNANSSIVVNHGSISAFNNTALTPNPAAIVSNSQGNLIINHGIIETIGGTAAVIIDVAGTGNTANEILNYGTISGNGTNAILGDTDDADAVANFGTIIGSVNLGGGDDFVNNEGSVQGEILLGDGEDAFQSLGSGFVVGGVSGEAGNDTFVLGADKGVDFYDGGADIDTVNYSGVLGAITIHLGSGKATGIDIGVDYLVDFEIAAGGAGNDRLVGNSSTVALYGGDGNDVLLGGNGSNDLFGQDGNDTINGYAGFDDLVGGAGNDTLTGGFNWDIFYFEDGFGADTITDFDANNNFEDINLAGVSSLNNFTQVQAAMTQVGANVVINAGNGDTITLLNVNMADLDAADFIF